MSAATDEAISTLAGAGAVAILAGAQYILAAARRRNEDKDDEDK